MIKIKRSTGIILALDFTEERQALNLVRNIWEDLDAINVGLPLVLNGGLDIVKKLKSTIHRSVVTDAKNHYMGSITIDKKLIQQAELLPFEKVLVVSIDKGERIENYVIEGREGSGEICINGADTRKIAKGRMVIIMSFVYVEEM